MANDGHEHQAHGQGAGAVCLERNCYMTLLTDDCTMQSESTT